VLDARSRPIEFYVEMVNQLNAYVPAVLKKVVQ